MSDKEETPTEEAPEYNLTYKVACHMPPIAAADVPQGEGACTSIVNACISEHEDTTSYLFTSVDGRTGEELVPEQMFQVWRMMARHLQNDLKKSGAQELCAEVTRMLDNAENLAKEAKAKN